MFTQVIVIAVLTATVCAAQRSGNAIARQASPSGMRNPGLERSQGPRIDANLLTAASKLLGVDETTLQSEYANDWRTCGIRLERYAALRRAESDYHFDRSKVLESMCKSRTASFEAALATAHKSAGLNSATVPNKSERDYLQEVERAIRR